MMAQRLLRQPPVIDGKEKQRTRNKLHSLCQKNPQAKGLAIVIGISGPPGIDDDVQNVSSTFKKDLEFAVWPHTDTVLEELACLLQVAAEFNYPISYKFIVFYYAGHGGSDDGHGYVIPAEDEQYDETNNKLFIDEGIVSPFRPINAPNLADRYRLFFFDCCLNESRKRGPGTPKLPTKPKKMNIPSHGKCLVAYSTSMTFVATGDTGLGGMWTRHLCDNLKLDHPITTILDITYDEVAEKTQKQLEQQAPHYLSCIGTVYLKDHSKSWKDLKTGQPGPSIIRTDIPKQCILSESTILQCLGRPFQLGMFYDCRNDQLIPGMTLWNTTLLRATLSQRPQHSSDFEIIAEDTLSDTISKLGIEANLSLSVMGGLVSVSGAAKYLDDRKSSRNQARVTLKYYCTSRLEQLTIEQLAVSEIQRPEVFDKGIATHVVTGIVYGAEAFFVFDREVTHSENYRDIHRNMEALVTTLPGISDIKGSSDVDIKDNDKQEVDKFHCKFYSDVILEENPSTFQDAVRVYRELPQLFGEHSTKAVPKMVWLHKLNSKAAQMVRQISTSLVTQAQQCLDILHVTQIRNNDLMKTKVYDYFPGYQHQLSQFREMINEFRVDFMKQIVRIRGGGSEEGELHVAELLKRVHQSPFNEGSLSKWLAVKEEEINVLSQHLDIMDKTPGINFTFSPGDLDSVMSDIKYNHVVSFEFKVAAKRDSFLKSMFAFLRTQKISSEFSTTFPKQWFQNTQLTGDMCLKAKQFTTFAEANKDSEGIKFVVTDSSEDDGIQDDKGAVVLLYEFGSPEEFEPPGQPTKLTATHVTHENVQLEWKQPQYGVESIKCYTVCYRSTSDPPDDWKTQKTKQTETAITINQLAPEAEYIFKVCAECGFGSSEESKLCGIIQTKTSPVKHIIAESTILTPGPPVIYKLPVRPVLVRKHMAKMEFGHPTYPPKPNRVLMVVGATGAGKSTLIDRIINYIFGVKWENDFRFKLIAEEVGQSQAHSQTQTITAYTFYWHEGSPLDYTLTVIDTPGFGDTRGLKRDQEITDHIREFFSISGKDGIDVLHGIGFVTHALARLTPTQKYISDSILSMFGKDIQNNIFIMTTFASGAQPPVMDAVKEAKIPYAECFCFSNSALFENPKNSKFAQMFWEMGYSSFDDFFKHFGKADTVSLVMTRQVLEERKQLETIVTGIQPQINAGLSKIDELQQEEQILKRRELEVLAYKPEVVSHSCRVEVPDGNYAITCLYCNHTCQLDSLYGGDETWKCDAMSGNESYATCRVCPRHCDWRMHHSSTYYYKTEKKTITMGAQHYNQAKSGKAHAENKISKMEEELKVMHQAVFHNIRQARECLQRLDEITLKPNPLTEVEYIDLLIKSEEQQKKPGWKNRVDYFYQVRQQAQLLSKMKDQNAVDKMTEESSKSAWKQFSGWLASKFSS